MNPQQTTQVSATTHELKTWPQYFEAILTGKKTFEIRRNDRKFKVGDILILREGEFGGSGMTDHDLTFIYSGRELKVSVTYIIPGGNFGINSDFVIMSIAPVLNNQDGVNPWPFYGYAPGHYQNTCVICKKDTIVDRLCFVCLECAVIKSKTISSLPAAPGWVKASNSVPDEYGKVHWRDAETKLPITAGAAYTAIRSGNNYLVEWLSESIPQESREEVRDSTLTAGGWPNPHDFSVQYKFKSVDNREWEEHFMLSEIEKGRFEDYMRGLNDVKILTRTPSATPTVSVDSKAVAMVIIDCLDDWREQSKKETISAKEFSGLSKAIAATLDYFKLLAGAAEGKGAEDEPYLCDLCGTNKVSGPDQLCDACNS